METVASPTRVAPSRLLGATAGAAAVLTVLALALPSPPSRTYDAAAASVAGWSRMMHSAAWKGGPLNAKWYSKQQKFIGPIEMVALTQEEFFGADIEASSEETIATVTARCAFALADREDKATYADFAVEDASCAKFEIPALECASWDSAAPVADGDFVGMEGPPRYMKVPNPFNVHPTLWPGAFDVRWIYDTTCTPAVKNAMCAVRMKSFSKSPTWWLASRTPQ